MKNPMRTCMEHTGMCATLKAVAETGQDTKKKVDRMEWWIISTFGVAFIGLVFTILTRNHP